MNKQLSASTVIGFGWQVVKANMLFFIAVMIVGGIVSGSADTISEMIAPSETTDFFTLPLAKQIALLLLDVIGWALTLIIGIGYNRISLSFCDQVKPPFETLFSFRGIFWKYAIMEFLRGLLVFAGLLMLIIPGIYFALSAFAAPFFIIDYQLSPDQAIKASFRVTKGCRWQLLGFFLLLILLNLGGFLCLVVGLLVTVPISLIATALAYRHLVMQTEGLEEFGITPPQPAYAHAPANEVPYDPYQRNAAPDMPPDMPWPEDTKTDGSNDNPPWT